ncbi:MAG: chromosomal replication initiator protein DnaA [Phycisphaerales bacterium]|nr:chromosomal replication initiator protein DnaA [Phycisphaerales bacterium]
MRNEPVLDWNRLLDRVRAYEPDLYRSWFKDLEAAQPERGELEVRADDLSHVQYLERHCRPVFLRAAQELTGLLVVVRFVGRETRGPVLLATNRPAVLAQFGLSADFVFDQFVVGPSNRLAHAACGAVCNQLGTLYNPLFLHGASGLGKTHLLQATCTEVLKRDGTRQVTYVTCESFVNDFVQAMAAGALPIFRENARASDLLVIDDVQFLANRESSQEELFHTFNALYQSGKQIILSADTPPNEIPTLEDRLVSRFNWGLVVQIDPPSRETRQAILHKKARLRGVEVPDEVIDVIAEHVEANIRLLEGALTRLITMTQLEGRPLTVETAREVLSSYATSKREQRPLRVSEILEVVSKHYGVRLQDLLGRKRTRSISHPRQVAMYLARRLTPLSLEEIGMHFGGRDHSTVLHAEARVENERTNVRELAHTLQQLTHQLLTRG